MSRHTLVTFVPKDSQGPPHTKLAFERNDGSQVVLLPGDVMAIYNRLLQWEPMECTDCQEPIGNRHKPSCHRQGMVSQAGIYRRPEPGRALRPTEPGSWVVTVDHAAGEFGRVEWKIDNVGTAIYATILSKPAHAWPNVKTGNRLPLVEWWKCEVDGEKLALLKGLLGSLLAVCVPIVDAKPLEVGAYWVIPVEPPLLFCRCPYSPWMVGFWDGEDWNLSDGRTVPVSRIARLGSSIGAPTDSPVKQNA
jgi:hypothetical protein